DAPPGRRRRRGRAGAALRMRGRDFGTGDIVLTHRVGVFGVLGLFTGVVCASNPIRIEGRAWRAAGLARTRELLVARLAGLPAGRGIACRQARGGQGQGEHHAGENARDHLPHTEPPRLRRDFRSPLLTSCYVVSTTFESVELWDMHTPAMLGHSSD